MGRMAWRHPTHKGENESSITNHMSLQVNMPNASITVTA